MFSSYATTSSMVSGKVDLARVKQEGKERILRCSGCLQTEEGEIDLVQVGLVGRSLVVAKTTANMAGAKTVEHSIRFSCTFKIVEGEPLPSEIFILSHLNDGRVASCKLAIPQAVIEFEQAVECPELIVEAIARRVDVEYRAFIDRGAGLIFSQPLKPEISVIIMPGEPAHIFSALRSLESSLLTKAEIFIPEDGENGELLANLRNVHRYKISSGILVALNNAFKEARGRIVMMMDPRANPLAGAFDIANSVFNKSDDVAAVVGRVLRPDGLLYEAGLVADMKGEVSLFGSGHQANGWEYLYEHEIDVASPALSFFRKDMLQTVLFDTTAETLLEAYTKLSLNFRKLGKVITYHPDILSTIFVADLNKDVIVPEVSETVQAEEDDESGYPLDDIYYSGEVAKKVEPAQPFFPSVFNKAGALVVLGHLTEDVLGEGRLHRIFEVLSKDGLAVTIFAMRGISCTAAQLRRDLPMTVQYVDGTKTSLVQFLEQSRGLYNLVVVWQLSHLRKVMELTRPFDLPVICDVSGREIFSDHERALMSKASTIWVERENEARRLRNIGIHHLEVIPLSDGNIGSEYLAEILPQMRETILSGRLEN